MSIELKPCPFCGSKGMIVKNNFPPRNKWRHPSCSNGNCIASVYEQDEQGGTHVDFLDDESAAKAWNIRIESVPFLGNLESLSHNHGRHIRGLIHKEQR